MTEVFSEVNIAQRPYVQKISLNDDAIQAVYFTADAKATNDNLIGELRETLNGMAIASGKMIIEKAGTQNYQIDFGKEIKVDANKNYYFVLRAENNDYEQWNYNPGS